MIDKHLLKLRARDDISAEEAAAMRAAVSGSFDVRADRLAVRQGEIMDHSMILLSGIAARRKDMRDGRRQYTELHVPGDFTDLHSFTLKYLEHDIVALSDCSFALVPHENLKKITERHPHLTRVLWFSTNVDASIHREWVVSLGSRSAIARMAHLFCEMYVRLEMVGLTRGDSYDLPISQQELGEMLGITSVHSNRTLQQLRKRGLIDFAGGLVTIRDVAALKQIAEFDASYLYLDRQAR
ncbi:MAG: Crp/Fnr family transcriptional regulator [Sphingomonas sp.]|nr:Crp/Fnr family transcriptional regulator [Sphingomonas sp.]